MMTPRALTIITLFLAVIYLLKITLPIAWFPFDLINDYDSNHLEMARRVLDGDFNHLYTNPSMRGFISTSYTPLHFFVLAPLLAVFGPHVILVRLLSLATFLGTLGVVWLEIRRTQNAIYADTAALVTLALLTAFMGFPYFGTVDHPMIFLSTCAFFAALRAPATRFGAVPAAVFIVLAFLMKQTAAFTGISIAVFLLMTNRRSLFYFLVVWILGVGVPLVILNSLTDGWLMFHTSHILSKVIVLDWWKLWYETMLFAKAAGIPWLLAIGAFFLIQARRPNELMAGLLILLWTFGLFPALAKDGATFAYLAPISPAIAILLVSAAERMAATKGIVIASFFLVLAVVPPLWRSYEKSVLLPDHYLIDGQRMTALVHETKGRILTDRHHGFLLADGRRPEYDLKLIWWLERRLGLTAAVGLNRDIGSGRYQLILSDEGYLLPATKNALSQRYRRREEPIAASLPGDPFPYRFYAWDLMTDGVAAAMRDGL